VGNFDGVHIGHRALIGHVLSQAKVRSLAPVLMTFDPHPALVLTSKAPALLTTTERKIDLILEIAPELSVIVQPFDAGFSRIEAEDFVNRILLGSLNARYVLVGKNFHFGRARRGTPELLRNMSETGGFEAEAFELSGDLQGEYSSSRARAELAAGNMEGVTHILGRPHAITGFVVEGDARGRELGFRTANLEGIEEALPPEGIYACLVCDATRSVPPTMVGIGAMSLGPRPTVNRGFAVEVHVLDYQGDLYEKRLRVHILHRLRGIERFQTLEELAVQIALDVANTRERALTWLQSHRVPLF
jgi:riboflavin kinase/FMN adenylyltransferase